MRHFIFFIFFFAFITIIFCPTSKGQYIISTGQTAAELANSLVGEGVEVTSASLNCDSTAIGLFKGTGDLGIDSGIVMSTGKVSEINVPFTAWGLPNTDLPTAGDADLNTLIAPTLSYDACILTFDFIPAGDTVQFNYVFASAEYGGWSCQINDVFGFFISGTDYPIENLAVIPGTNIPVCVNSTTGIPGTEDDPGCTEMGEGSPFSEYYIDNTGGDYIKFGGFTTVFTALANVIPCQTYTLKFGIADASDGILDSGVFIEAGSLNSIPTHEITGEGGGSMTGPNANIVRGCPPGSFTISKTYITDYDESLAYTLEGTAINGIDYEILPGIAVIPAGETSVEVPIVPIVFDHQVGTKTVIPVIYSSMACMEDVFGDTIYIYDSLFLESTTFDTTICKGKKIQIDVATHPDFEVSWDPSPNLQFAPDEYTVILSPIFDAQFIVRTNLIGSGCADRIDEINVKIQDPPVNLDYNIISDGDRLCVLDTVRLYSSGASTYKYYDRNNEILGQGDSLDLVLGFTDNYYIVVGTDEDGCINKDSLIIPANPCCEIAVPTAFSPNGDGLNDAFGPLTDGLPENYRIEIYNRWGQRVFSSSKVEDHWDGTMSDGKEAQGGIYHYIIRGRCNLGETFTKKGDLTLIR